MIYRSLGKRVLDLILSGIVAILVSPILVVVGLAIMIEDGAPVIYRQLRVGRNEKPFTIFKFRSMAANTALVPSATIDRPHVTRVGRIIRRLNVDELPQLLNILKGDMSFVGPRPALASQVTLIDRRSEGLAMTTRPGLTGLAQVRAFDGMDEALKATYDNVYANKVTLQGDLKIIALTVGYLFRPPPTY